MSNMLTFQTSLLSLGQTEAVGDLIRSHTPSFNKISYELLVNLMNPL